MSNHYRTNGPVFFRFNSEQNSTQVSTSNRVFREEDKAKRDNDHQAVNSLEETRQPQRNVGVNCATKTTVHPAVSRSGQRGNYLDG